MRWPRFFLLLSALMVAGCLPKSAPETLWIGQLLPLAGPSRASGQHARQGVELAVAQTQAAEQTVGGHPCGVLHVDSGGDSATVQAETVRLLTVNKAVALLGGFEATLTERLIRESRPYGVPVIVPGELPGGADSDRVLALGVAPAVRGRLLARHAATDLHLKRAAVLTDGRDSIASVVAAAFVKNWPRNDAGAIEEWTFTTAAERDERTARLIETAPAVVLLACSVTDFRALRPRLAVALPKAPLLHGGEDAGVAPLQAELEARPDVYLATAYSPEHLSETGRAFARQYEERFHEPPDLYAAQSYDAYRLVFETMLRIGSANKDALVRELAHLEQFDSVTGPVRWKERQARRRVFLVLLRDNRPKVVATLQPEEN